MGASSPRWTWLAPLAFLTAVAGGVALVRSGSAAWFGALVIGLVVLPALWVLASALSPAKADRRCPACGRETLVRRSRDSTQGLACGGCGWVDAEASAWLLAEEEGPLEEIVLAQRNRSPGLDRPA
jgi:ribosomal protein L37AE/L43A